MEANIGKRTQKYSCDSCRSRKVACSRESDGCNQCANAETKCIYSRSGLIRRKRKRTTGVHDSSQAASEASIYGTSNITTTERSADVVQCHLAADIETTREQLSGNITPQQQGSLHALSSLSEACTNTGLRHEAPKLQIAPWDFYPFEDCATEWADIFEDFLRKSEMLLGTAPPEVMKHLRAGHPSQVHPRAWLVMYYSVILSTVACLTVSLREKLQCHLSTALSDIGVLLEPSEANIHAITLALSQASEFTGPSLCWMLATSACRMLQALGVNQRTLNPQTRERRQRIFWNLNLLDKGLAIIFGRTPTFHRAMVRHVGLPKMGQLQSFRSHVTSTGTSMLFAASFMYQKILLSHVMGDIWHCLYDEEKPNEHSIKASYKDLVSWYNEAQRVLDAAALSEKPFCDTKNAKSIDVALRTMEFQFLYLCILLTRFSLDMQEECLHSSKLMLNLLRYMSPECREPYHPMIWQLVCCPFTPLLILLRATLSNHTCSLEEKKEILEAMELFPGYLKDLGQRNSLAQTLEGIAKVLVEHARSAIYRQSTTCDKSDTVPPGGAQASAVLPENLPWPTSDETFRSNLFGSGSSGIMPNIFSVETSDFDTSLIHDFTTLSNSFHDDKMLDWLTWDITAQRDTNAQINLST